MVQSMGQVWQQRRSIGGCLGHGVSPKFFRRKVLELASVVSSQQVHIAGQNPQQQEVFVRV
jgi:hypothetical protein